MESKQIVASASDGRQGKKKSLSDALNVLSELLGVEFGSVTIKFHNGKWSPKIEIEKRMVQEIKE